MIFYFTATGNSLYVAKKLGEMPISIPQIIHNDKTMFSDDAIGIVCPVFGHEVPPMVREFMERATFNTDYFFMVLTYGNRHGGAAELADKRCKECGIYASYINTLLMVDNFLPVFDMDEQKKLDKKVDTLLADILADIQMRKHMIQPATEQDRQAHAQFLAMIAQQNISERGDMYQITENCSGCGICANVCPAGCYQIENGRAVLNNDGCQFCMACIHHCPQKSIQFIMPEKNPNARYRNDYISLQEIIVANKQNG